MKEAWKNLPLLTKIAVIAVAVILLFILYKQIAKYVKAKRQQSVLEDSTEQTTINNLPVSVNLGSIAQQIYGAFHEYYGGLAEDEETAIIAVNNVPKALIPKLSDTYFKLYSLNLNAEFVKYLDSNDYKRVEALFT